MTPGTGNMTCSCTQPQQTPFDPSQPKQPKISASSNRNLSHQPIYESTQSIQRNLNFSSNNDLNKNVFEPVPRRQRQISTSSNHSLQQLLVNELPQQRKRKISSYSLHYQSNPSPLPRTPSSDSYTGPSSEIHCILTPLQRLETSAKPSTTQSVYLLQREQSTESATCAQPTNPQGMRKISYNNQIAIMDDDDEVTEDGSKMVVRLVLPQSTYASLEANEEDSGIGPPPSPPSSSIASMTNSGSRLRTPSQFNFDGPFLLAGALDDTKTYPNYANHVSHDLPSEGVNHFDVKLGQDVSRQRRSPTFDSPPLASAEHKKKDAFWEKLTVILSAVYAVFLVTFGFVIGVADLIIVDSNIGEAYSLYLILVGLLWFLFLHMDVRRNSRRIRGLASRNAKQDIFSLTELKHPKDANNLPPYLYSHSRHSGSFFLKIGAAGFCFGHLIHSTLLMSRQIFYTLSEDELVQKNCADQTALLESILHPVYSFYQLYILFKYSSIIINRCKELARFAIMHCLATSLYYWFSMILRETLDSLQHKLLIASKEIHSDDDTDDIYAYPKQPFPILSAVKAAEGSKSFIATLNISNSIFKLDVCHNESEFSNLLLSISPYLYPFSIEYSILVVGIWYILWQNIGKFEEFWKETKSHEHEQHSHDERTRSSSVKDALSNKLVLHADCHSANGGLFAGLLILVATVVTVILFFVSCAHKEYVDVGKLVNQVSEIGLLLLMIGSALFAYNQMRQLDINPHPISLLDDLLLFLCIPCFLLYGIFSVVPDIHYNSYVPVVSVLLQVIQVVIQTPFIIDGLRRCSNNGNPRAKKPGRELVTFLIICNLAMWIIETFEIKSYETNENRINFYGYPLWAFLSHVTLPLTLFYRFHSSVCLVDIWKSAYEPGE